LNFLYRNLTTRRLYAIGLAVPFFCIVVIGFLQWMALRDMLKTRLIVRHTRDAQVALGVFRYSLSDAESCQFRYILSHYPADIDLYRKLMADVDQQLAILDSLSPENSPQRYYLEKIQPLVAEKKRLTEQSFQMEQSGDHAGAMAIISGAPVRENMLSIEKAVEDFQGIELGLLATWQNIYQHNFKIASVVSVLSVALCFGCIIMILLLLRSLSQLQSAVTLSALKELIEYEDGTITIEEFLKRRHAALLAHGPAQIEAERLLGLIERRKSPSETK
jgi:CHASE3 domain sensor protein